MAGCWRAEPRSRCRSGPHPATGPPRRRSGADVAGLTRRDRSPRAGRTCPTVPIHSSSSWSWPATTAIWPPRPPRPRRPALARALTEVAAERSRHATALIEEIARAARKPTPTSSESASPTTTSAAAGATAERRRRRRHAAQLRRERHQAGTDPVGVSRRSAGVDRGVLHDAVLGGAAVEGPAPVTSPTPTPDRPAEADKAALFDAVATEHAAIYGYGIVSAHSSPDENDLVSAGAGRAPRATRGGDRDAVRALGQGSAARRRLPVAVPGHHPGRRRRSWRFGWRTTARWRGAR